MRISSHGLLLQSDLPIGGGLEGRRQDQRARLVGQRGGTPASENAVELGLAWLAAHQRQDGGWRLNHHEGPCRGRCRNPGTVGTSTGATALALLPFLGAGYTHQQGKYRKVVQDGLYYLTGRMLETRFLDRQAALPPWPNCPQQCVARFGHPLVRLFDLARPAAATKYGWKRNFLHKTQEPTAEESIPLGSSPPRSAMEPGPRLWSHCFVSVLLQRPCLAGSLVRSADAGVIPTRAPSPLARRPR